MVLRYETNSAHFDFPEYNAFPSIRYIVASSPRCGSNLLQRALWRSGVAGAPEEYLTEGYANDFAARWETIRDSGGINPNDYLQMLMRFRTSPNGAFGLKVHGSHLSNVFLSRLNLDQHLQVPTYIVLRRRNKFLQAVSYALARQTGIWILDGAWLPDTSALITSPNYSFEEIVSCLDGIVQEEQVWDRYLLDRAITPYFVVYEELVDNLHAVTLKVLHQLGVELTGGQSLDAGIRQQATALNHEWADRFESDLKRADVLLQRIDEGVSSLDAALAEQSGEPEPPITQVLKS